MKTIGLIIILSAYILIINGYCQSIDNNVVFSVTDYKRLGKGAEKAGDYRAAIKYYELYNSVKSNNAEVNFRLGELYRNIREYRQAKECYYKTWNQSPLKYPEALYYYGIMLKMDGQYAEAKTMLEKFIKTPVDDKKILDLKIKAREELTNFDKINILVQKNENVTITMLDSSINRAHTELSPIPFNDSLLIFSSVRPSNAGDIQNNVAEFYTAHRKDNNWTSDDINVLPFNNSGENTCNGTFSKDGNHFYFTRCEILKSNKANCELFVSIKSGDEWVAPVKLDKMINMSGFTNTQPSVGIDFKTEADVLYFVSDRPGGFGGLDIWFAVYNKSDNKFDAPQNAGNKINTRFDEATPFYDLKSNALYFSSNGHAGLGGFDIFKASGAMRKWTEPVNLNPPVNSSVDDLYYVLLNNSEGFFVSNRGNNSSSLHSTCCDDIFAFAYNANKEIELLTESINNSDTITISQVEMEMMKQETFVLNNIYYEFDKSELTADAKKVIDSTLLVILKKEPDISLQINSFTDNLGNNEYNLELSNQRTQSVVNYLISKGISKNRLITTAFGEIVPMVDNFYSDGSDNPEGREMNRRTEFRILLNNSYLAEIIKKENNFP